MATIYNRQLTLAIKLSNFDMLKNLTWFVQPYNFHQLLLSTIRLKSSIL